MVRPKPLLNELGIHPRFESCEDETTRKIWPLQKCQPPLKTIILKKILVLNFRCDIASRIAQKAYCHFAINVTTNLLQYRRTINAIIKVANWVLLLFTGCLETGQLESLSSPQHNSQFPDTILSGGGRK